MSAALALVGPVDRRAALVEAVLQALIAKGSLVPQAIDRARRAADGDERLDRVLNKLGLVADDALTEAWSAELGLPVATHQDYPAEPLLQEALRSDFLAHAQVLPLRLQGDHLELAVVDPLDDAAPWAVAAKTGLTIERRLARPGEFAQALKRLYGRASQETSPDDGLSVDDNLSDDVERLRDQASDAPVIRIVNGLIDRAIELKASDIHVSATRTGLRIRYRVDGALQDVEPPPAQLQAAIISRLKIMAGLDIAERRLPQDGRIRIAWRGREVDLRIATMPHVNGEGAVLRVLDRSALTLDFEGLGLSPPIQQGLARVLAEPHGLFLVTGPTGSGKTTTLYAALKTVTRPDRNVVTVEEPVEYQVEGVNQIQVHRRIGLDFAGALRSVLRQDPDVIMVGEIRDRETAAVANQAALTGHLVLATIHTNTAAAALPRLIDMGIEPYLLASTLRGSMAQRLVRRLCPHCREGAQVPIGRWSALTCRSPISCYRPVGCEACKGNGYAGRVAIAELMTMSQPIRDGLLRQTTEAELAHCAAKQGFRPMVEDGLDKVEAGVTSVEEVLRAVGAS